MRIFHKLTKKWADAQEIGWFSAYYTGKAGFWKPYLLFAVLPLLPMVIYIIFKAQQTNATTFILLIYVILYSSFYKANIYILRKSLANYPNDTFKKLMVNLYTLILIPVVMVGLLSLVAFLGWIGFKDIISPLSPLGHPTVWIAICFFYAVYLVNKSLKIKG